MLNWPSRLVQHRNWTVTKNLRRLQRVHPSHSALTNELVHNMGEHFFYVRFMFIPKSAPLTPHKAIVEVPKDLVQRKQLGLRNEKSEEKVIALDLARRAALAAISTRTERLGWPYDEDALWCEGRHYVLDERPCDHEENGVRVWRID